MDLQVPPYKFDQNENPVFVDDLNEIYGMGKSYVYDLVNKGVLPHYRVGSKKLYFFASEINYAIRTGQLSISSEVK